MKKILLKLALLGATLFAYNAANAQTVAVTADLKTMFNAGAATKTQVCFSLTDGNGNQLSNPRTSSGVIVPTATQCVSPDGSGHISTTVIANDQITPSNSIYSVTYTFNGRVVHGDIFQFALADGTENLNTKTSLSTVPVVSTPTGDTTYARLDGGNSPFTGNETFNGSVSVKGTLQACNTINGVHWVCDLTSGADLGAKINTAASNGGVVAISPGMVATSISTALSLPAGTSLYFPPGAFTSSVPLVFTVDKVKIHGFGKGITVLQYTGGAVSSFVKFGTATPTTNQLLEVSLEDMTIKGSANVTDTVFITGVHHSTFAHLDLKDATGACFHSQFSVMPYMPDVECSLNTGAFVQQPTNCILLDQIDSGHQTTAGMVIVPKCEGVSGTGIKCTGCSSMTIQSGTSEQNNRGIEETGGGINNRNTFDTIDLESNTVEDVLSGGVASEYRNLLGVNKIHFSGAAIPRLVGGMVTSITIDSGVNNAHIETSWNQAGTGTITDNGTNTYWRLTNPSTGSLISLISGSGTFGGGAGTEVTSGWSYRDTVPPKSTGLIGTPDSMDMIRGNYNFNTSGIVLSTTPVASAIWRLLLIGSWANNIEGGGLAQPASIQEVTSASPTITIGSQVVTFSKNGSNQLVGTTTANVIQFVGTIFVSSNIQGLAGTASAVFKGSVTAPGLPQVIASGTAAMTTAGIATGACGTTVTVTGTGILTTDTIDISRNAAATIGNGGGLTLNFWPTAGNVNFNYCNSSAGIITPTAMTVNWSVRR